MRQLFLYIALTLVSIGAKAQATSIVYNPGVTSEGVNYYLPKTKFILTVKVTRQSSTPGEFCRYAERYLRLTNVLQQTQEVWNIESIELNSVGVPDRDRFYTLQFEGSKTKPYFELNADGILSAINTHGESAERSLVESNSITTAPKINPYNYLTEEILLSSSTAKMAELTAKEIYSCRESRNSITRGQAESMPKDGASLQLLLDELTKQEEALLQLFCGTITTESREYRVEITPTSSVKGQVAMRFSTRLGVLSADNLAGAPIFIDIKNLEYLPQSSLSVKDEKFLGKNRGNILYYTSPGRAEVKIYDNNNVYINKEYPIAQFGNVEILSSTYLKRMPNSKIVFCTTTGNILSIEN